MTNQKKAKREPEEIAEDIIKKDHEDIEYQNAMMAAEFDMDNIALMGEGEKTDEEIEDIKGEEEKDSKPKGIEIERSKKRRRRHVTCTIRRDMNIYRKAYSETQLLDIMTEKFKEGESYHCISGGDVDSLSYLKVVLRQQDLEYCFISTWCMAMDDVLQLEEWLEAGKIKKMDAYVGEIFTGTYGGEYAVLKPLLEKHGGKVVIFRNHSKVIAGYGKEFYFATESSANINTNPRAENTVLTIGKGIYEFYKNYFDGIISFVKEDRKEKEKNDERGNR